MGIYLSRPLTSKESDVQESDCFAACSTDMQGWRVYMEDSHIMYLDTSKETDELALFGVFDGHGGPAVSRWVAIKFIELFKEFCQQNEAMLKSSELEFRVPHENLPVQRIAAVAHSLERTFLHIDERLLNTDAQFERELRVCQAASMRLRKREMTAHGIEEPNGQSFFRDLMDGKRWKITEEDGSKVDVDAGLVFSDLYSLEMEKDENEGEAEEQQVEDFNSVSDYTEKRQPYDPQSCGCTAVVASVIVTPEPVLVVANAGDSRCVLSRGGVAIPMTVDHKPMQEREMLRISNAGGTVTNGRVDGNLNLSRSLGDLHYKNNTSLPPQEQKITAMPDLTYMPLCNTDVFIVLACDGIWDILTEQQCIDKVHELWDQLEARNKSEGINMTEGEMCQEISARLCDHCLAPTPFDPESAGAGCDNMTAMVIRVKDEWRKTFPPYAEAEHSMECKLYGTEAEKNNYAMIDLVTR